jgi:hypothetical protein
MRLLRLYRIYRKYGYGRMAALGKAWGVTHA